MYTFTRTYADIYTYTHTVDRAWQCEAAATNLYIYKHTHTHLEEVDWASICRRQLFDLLLEFCEIKPS